MKTEDKKGIKEIIPKVNSISNIKIKPKSGKIKSDKGMDQGFITKWVL